MHEAEDRTVVRIHPQHRVQIKPAPALRSDHRGILDRQNAPAPATPSRARRSRGRHLLHRHSLIAKEPGQTDLPGPAPAQPPHPNAPPAHLNQARVQERPPFSRRRSPNRLFDSAEALIEQMHQDTDEAVRIAG